MRGRPEITRISLSEPRGGHRILRIRSQRVSAEAFPGSYVALWIPGVDEIPMAVAWAGGGEVEVVAGPPRGEATRALHAKAPGDLVGLRGPFGRPLPPGDRVAFVVSSHGEAYASFYSRVHRGRVSAVIALAEEGEALYGRLYRSLGISVVETKDPEDLMGAFSRISKVDGPDLWVVCLREDLGRRVLELLAPSGGRILACVERPIKCSLGLCGACDLGLWRPCLEGIFMGPEVLLATEYGMWTRDRSGSRIPLRPGSPAERGPALLPRRPLHDPVLSTRIAGIAVGNPLTNAAGCALAGSMLYRFALEGAGAVVTKSVGLEPRRGFRGPVMIEDPSGVFINSIGLSNPGARAYALEIRDAKMSGVPVIGSVFGRSVEEYLEASRILVEAGVDGIELNISCPHTEFEMVEDDPALVEEIVRRLRQGLRVPLLVKLSPNSDYTDIARRVERAGADGVTAINTLRGYAYDHVVGSKILGSPHGYGGISGPSLKPLVRRAVAELRGSVGISIVAAGGIDSARDVLELLSLGAEGFQICSAIAYKGLSIFREILEELRSSLRAMGFRSLEEASRRLRRA